MKFPRALVTLAALCLAGIATADDFGLVGKWVATKYGDTITIAFNDDGTIYGTNSDPRKAAVLAGLTHYWTVLSQNNPVTIEIVVFKDDKPDPLVTYSQLITFLAPDLIEMAELRIRDGHTTESNNSLLLRRIE